MTESTEAREANATDGPERDARVSRLYRSAGGGEPPAALDAAILKAARDAVATGPAPTSAGLSWWRRFQLPAAVALTSLLAVMLSLTMERKPPEVLDSAARDSAPPPSAPAAAGPAKEAPPAAGRVEHKAKTVTPPPSGRNEVTATAAPAAPAPPVREQRQAMPAAELQGTRIDQGAGMASERARDAAPAASAAPPAGAMAPAPAAPAGFAAPRSPSASLEEIRELRRQGKHDEAARRLEAFRVAYPDYLLPDDLR